MAPYATPQHAPDHELTVEVPYWWLRYQPETVARVAPVARVAS